MTFKPQTDSEFLRTVGQWFTRLSWRDRLSRIAADLDAAAAQQREPLRPVDGDVLPPIGSDVYIRHGRDGDEHLCTVVGYYAWRGLDRATHMHRVFVRVVYKGTRTENARLLGLDSIRPADNRKCDVPPAGWTCSRGKGHDGPCAAREVTR